MSERVSFPSSPSDPNASTAPGQRLRAERERRGLSVQQVAADLHVDATTIEALEAGRLASLGAPVHVKGHLRKYATLLGLDPELLLAESQVTQPVPELVPLKPATRPSRFRVDRPTFLLVVAIVLAVALGWVLAKRGEVGEPAPPPSVVQAPPAAVQAPPSAAPTMETQVAPSTTPTAQVLPAEVRSNEERGVAVARVGIRMSFTSDSWVEIYDSAEQRVFFDMGTTGTSRAVAADAPLRVFLGNAEGVRLELDGQAVTVPVEARRGNLAEFSLDARGGVTPRRQR